MYVTRDTTVSTVKLISMNAHLILVKMAVLVKLVTIVVTVVIGVSYFK